jgi:phosphoribosylformimino-5-aminoimidazole carboxamide ribotide isomerase
LRRRVVAVIFSASMDLFPAIDIRAGRVVRLSQGEAGREKAYSTDPVAQAEQFVADGARWIHVVDLDRAFGTGQNLGVLRSIVERVGGRVKIQTGGGIRDLAALRTVLELGVTRAVLGTATVTDPDLVPDALQVAGPDGIVIGLDARDGKVAIRGWVEKTDLAVADVCARVLRQGARHVVYTDVGRDGMLSGPDIEGAVALQGLGASVIASGGVASLDDLTAVAQAGLSGAIVGRAIYEGRFTVPQALDILAPATGRFPSPRSGQAPGL